MRISPLLVLFPALALSQGCVLKARLDETLAKQLQCNADLKRMASERDQLGPKLDDTHKRLAEAEARNEELSQANQMLAEKNSDFSKRSIEAQQELLRVKEAGAQSETRAALPRQTASELTQAFQNEILAKTADVTLANDDIVLTFANEELFSGNRDDLTPSGRALLERAVTVSKKLKFRLLYVESHGDPPPRKTAKGAKAAKAVGSWEFTSIQALKVVRVLQENGIDGARLSAAARGDFVPGARSKGDAPQSQNRRVELRFRL